MSKNIKLNESMKAELLAEFEKTLNEKFDGNVAFNKVMDKLSDKAKVVFTQAAWYKMTALVKSYSTEVAWHGSCSRLEKDGDVHKYLIDDILVYPQTVTGATVTMDEISYSKWIFDNIEDERFNRLSMQGHSHVNMAVSPSGTDISHQLEILNQLTGDNFYIFIIINKRNEINFKIYDLKENLMFDNSDVTMSIDCDGVDLQEFLKESESVVKKTPTTYGGSYGANYVFGGGSKAVTTTTSDTSTKNEVVVTDIKKTGYDPVEDTKKQREKISFDKFSKTFGVK